MAQYQKSPFHENLMELSDAQSVTAQRAKANYQRKIHECQTVAGVGFGVLGNGYDIRPQEKKEFFKMFVEENKYQEDNRFTVSFV